MSSYSIKQLELVSGIKAHTIRMWEKRYGLFSPQRTDTNIRRYNDFDIQLILNISLLIRNGFRISKVASKSSEDISEMILQITTKQSIPEKYNLEPLILSMLAFNQSDFKSYIDRMVNELGLEKTYDSIIIPLLYKVGILWQIGMINSAHEHFVSNIIKNAIIFHTEMLKEPKKDSSYFLYFLPEGEYHEIGLLFYVYIGKMMGYRTLYLGQSSPIGDVIQMAKEIKPSVLVTSVSTMISKINLTEYLQNLHKNISNAYLFITGYRVNQEKVNIPKEVHVISTSDTFVSKIKSLKIK